MPQRLKNGRFRVQVRGGGFPPFDKVFDTEADAKREEQRERALRTAPTLYDDSMTLAEVATRYFESGLFEAKADNTQRSERSKIKPVLAELGGFAVRHLKDGQRIADYKDARLHVTSKTTKRKIGFNTVRLELAALASVFSWAVERKILSVKPTIGVTRPHTSPRERRLTDSEAHRLNMFLSSSVTYPEILEPGRFVVIQRDTGCRPGELAHLRRQDWDPRASTVTFRHTKDKRRSRTSLVSPYGAKLLAEQLEFAKVAAPDSPYVFTTWKRNGEPRDYHYKTGVALLRELGIVDSDFHAHASRREFISKSLEMGVPHNDIMKQVGQRSYAALMAYDQGKANHPAVRERLKAGAEGRQNEEFGKLAEVLGTSLAHVESRIGKARAAVPVERPKRRRARRWKDGDPLFGPVPASGMDEEPAE